MSSQRREHFRLVYPIAARPVMVVQGTEFRLSEISEEGGRAIANTDDLASLEQQGQVTIGFSNGKQVGTNATVLRVDGDEIILKLSPAIALSVILEQQRWLVSRYPKEQHALRAAAASGAAAPATSVASLANSRDAM